jgi:hypothetical protein
VNRQQAVCAALEQYDRLRASWLESLTPEQLAQLERNKEAPYCPKRRCTIDREANRAIYGSMMPYVGYTPLRRK